jgi:LysM repeat protein
MSKIKGVLLIICLLLAQWGWSQTELAVQGASPDLYLMHTVEVKETWYSIGRLYNVNPKDIATLNNVSLSKLNMGQQLKIPLSDANFSQDGQKKADEVFVPVYHTVQDKEWMFRISQNYNKVPIETLEKWNNVTNDKLQAGMKLVVGYLKVSRAHSKLAASGLKKLPAVATAPVAKKEELKLEEPKKEDAKKEIATTPVVPTVPETTKTQVKNTSVPVESAESEGTYSGYKGGYFRSGYAGNGKKSTAGNAGIFRSTSGWKDGKYYALMNKVPVGTIVKVTYTSSNKTVFAKVLGQLPDMRESSGLTLRLSDAAAAELGAEMGKFYVDVTY